ncbi:Methyltransferase domain containing protein [Desulfocurvibacter africanus PCS]|uniref:Methyltransferase domain containing protein n=1 Tax=Desulfocurvibacter africanus PCS TaxID=1262666 RepID=M5Q2G0_DESAF|nr:class I SAM-dependent methyltransferase [Desulfocurvibacter africanus]EMG38421.1 Methyltransferase domain containing protein [Desulfocurvibacter africanus PCS]
MSVFGDYARYYNVLYQDKDYAGEAAYILQCLRACGCIPSTLLDLGCGTGRHALEMARRGIAVTGVDLSETMLQIGRRCISQHGATHGAPLPELLHGDARTVRLGRRFDAVTSLFHVMSYHNTEEAALDALLTAKAHLGQDGVFLFDFWYGPGVMLDPPAERDRRMEDAHTIIERHARPVHRIHDNLVEVHYSIRLIDKASRTQTKLEEMHPMRYWFLPELRHLARSAGMAVVAEGAWLQESLPATAPWNAWMALRCK